MKPEHPMLKHAAEAEYKAALSSMRIIGPTAYRHKVYQKVQQPIPEEGNEASTLTYNEKFSSNPTGTKLPMKMVVSQVAKRNHFAHPYAQRETDDKGTECLNIQKPRINCLPEFLHKNQKKRKMRHTSGEYLIQELRKKYGTMYGTNVGSRTEERVGVERAAFFINEDPLAPDSSLSPSSERPVSSEENIPDAIHKSCAEDEIDNEKTHELKDWCNTSPELRGSASKDILHLKENINPCALGSWPGSYFDANLENAMGKKTNKSLSELHSRHLVQPTNAYSAQECFLRPALAEENDLDVHQNMSRTNSVTNIASHICNRTFKKEISNEDDLPYLSEENSSYYGKHESEDVNFRNDVNNYNLSQDSELIRMDNPNEKQDETDQFCIQVDYQVSVEVSQEKTYYSNVHNSPSHGDLNCSYVPCGYLPKRDSNKAFVDPHCASHPSSEKYKQYTEYVYGDRNDRSCRNKCCRCRASGIGYVVDSLSVAQCIHEDNSDIRYKSSQQQKDELSWCNAYGDTVDFVESSSDGEVLESVSQTWLPQPIASYADSMQRKSMQKEKESYIPPPYKHSALGDTWHQPQDKNVIYETCGAQKYPLHAHNSRNHEDCIVRKGLHSVSPHPRNQHGREKNTACTSNYSRSPAARSLQIEDKTIIESYSHLKSREARLVPFVSDPDNNP